MKINLPKTSEHISIVGSTGSGKTVAAAWHLSHANFDVMPWVVLNYKGDELIEQLNTTLIDYSDIPPVGKKWSPGIYELQPLPGEEDSVDEFLQHVWERGNCGVWVDEGYMLKGSKWANALLTQGRSKRNPLITLSQRPVWLSRFVFSESSFFQVFRLTDKRDRETVQSFMPERAMHKLPEFYSWYFDVKKNKLAALKPTPPPEIIVERINTRLDAMKPSRQYL
jgi:hypothetical protein